VLHRLTRAQAEALLYDWSFWARPKQLEPAGDWTTWALITGRGYGKTRTAAEWVRSKIDTYGRWALVARAPGDVRDVMIEGESGLMRVFPRHERPDWQPSRRRLTFHNGALATTFGSYEPDELRGPQHEAAWSDEVATWKYPETWDNLQLGLRLGPKPRQVVTSTPRPLRIIRELLAATDVVVTRGTTYENRANLAAAFYDLILSKYEGTTLGRQEIHGELLDELPGALWRRALIDAARIAAAPEQQRIVIAIDPATTHGEDSDQTGIAIAGRGLDGDYYVFGIEGYRLTPLGWGKRAVDEFDRWAADRIVAESNQGGEMVEANIRNVRRDVPVELIHAKRGKVLRAEPIAALYEQGRVHHVGMFADAEDQLCRFPVATDLDDMVDALVHALTELEAVPAPAGATGPPPETIKEQIERRRLGIG